VTGLEEAPVAARVAILLSTYNGEQFLAEQFASLSEQTIRDWVLYWRDDGSTDGTPRMMADLLATLGAGRSIVVPSDGRVRASESFLRLLRIAAADACDVVAFADQDDVWLPEKLARGLAALGEIPAENASAVLRAPATGGRQASAHCSVGDGATTAGVPGSADTRYRNRLHADAQPRRCQSGCGKSCAGRHAA
jgi:glycosyltransferase involved in cell wall biosynthesis